MKTTTTIRTMLVLSVLYLLTAGASARTINIASKGRILGRVNDFATNLPIEYASVDLYSATDSMLVAGTLSGIEGEFTISMVDKGRYYLEISTPGFAEKLVQQVTIEESAVKINLGEISLIRESRKSPKLQSPVSALIENRNETKKIFSKK